MNEDRATRYQRLRRRASLASTGTTAALLGLLVASGGAVALREASAALSGGWLLPAGLLVVFVTAAMNELLLVPLAYFQGVTLERRYGLSTQSTSRWWVDHVRTSALTLFAAVVAGAVVLLLLDWTPRWWWVGAAACFTAALVLLTQIAPAVLLPMFDACEPLRREALVARLMRLAARANTQVVGVFEWHVGGRTKKGNAALAGLGTTRRILVSDTLLAAHSDDEVEVILAHELAHHVHHDIWTAIGVQALLIAIAAYASDFVLTAAVGPLGLSGKADAAGLPLIALSFGAVWKALTPLANAVSRAHERRADRYALEMTGNAQAFVSAMRRLAAQNLSDDSPTPLIECVFNTHPPPGARIAAAQTWARQAAAGGSRQ